MCGFNWFLFLFVVFDKDQKMKNNHKIFALYDAGNENYIMNFLHELTLCATLKTALMTVCSMIERRLNTPSHKAKSLAALPCNRPFGAKHLLSINLTNFDDNCCILNILL
jgi:hypothetical protein